MRRASPRAYTSFQSLASAISSNKRRYDSNTLPSHDASPEVIAVDTSDDEPLRPSFVAGSSKDVTSARTKPSVGPNSRAKKNRASGKKATTSARPSRTAKKRIKSEPQDEPDAQIAFLTGGPQMGQSGWKNVIAERNGSASRHRKFKLLDNHCAHVEDQPSLLIAYHRRHLHSHQPHQQASMCLSHQSCIPWQASFWEASPMSSLASPGRQQWKTVKLILCALYWQRLRAKTL